MSPSLKSLLILLSLLLPALLINLGERPLYKIQEVRIAETAREMLESEDWIVPRYNGELRLQKPPLPYWLTAASFRIAGVNEFATRLPAVVFGLASALLLWSWMRTSFGLGIAGNTVLAFVVSYIGLRYFRSGEADAMLLFFICASCWLGYALVHGKQGRLLRPLFGLALGLGFLSKGPAAIAIPLSALIVHAIIEKPAHSRGASVRRMFDFSAVATLVFVAFAWYGWMLWQMPEIAQGFFSHQVDETFISGSHAKSHWWYLLHWVEFFAPWGLLLLPAGVLFVQRRRQLPTLVRFSWLWLAVVFVLLTATINKQMQYALLFAPPAAIILGHYLECADGRFLWLNRAFFWVYCVAMGLAILATLSKSDNLPLASMWLALPLLPILGRRLLRETQPSLPILVVAGLGAMAYLYSETYMAREPRKVAAQALMAQADARQPLFQSSSLRDGALSFYAGRVIKPVADEEIVQLLSSQPTIWLISETQPELRGVSVQVAMDAGEFKLYKLRKEP